MCEYLNKYTHYDSKMRTNVYQNKPNMVVYKVYFYSVWSEYTNVMN